MDTFFSFAKRNSIYFAITTTVLLIFVAILIISLSNTNNNTNNNNNGNNTSIAENSISAKETPKTINNPPNISPNKPPEPKSKIVVPQINLNAKSIRDLLDSQLGHFGQVSIQGISSQLVQGKRLMDKGIQQFALMIPSNYEEKFPKSKPTSRLVKIRRHRFLSELQEASIHCQTRNGMTLFRKDGKVAVLGGISNIRVNNQSFFAVSTAGVIRPPAYSFDYLPLLLENLHHIINIDTSYHHGLFMPRVTSGDCKVCYKLDGKYFQIIGSVGIHYEKALAVGQPMKFSIHGDGKELWRETLTKKGEMKSFAIRIEGIEDLELRVNCNRPLAVWLNPQLIYDEIILVSPSPENQTDPIRPPP